jgi:hypothetical protein
MSSLASQLSPIVAGVIRDFGNDAVLRVTAAGFNPATGEVTGSSSDHPVKVSPPDPNVKRYVDQGQFRDPSAVLGAEAVVILSASGLTVAPKAGHRLVLESSEWHIVSANQITMQNVTLAWLLALKR